MSGWIVSASLTRFAPRLRRRSSRRLVCDPGLGLPRPRQAHEASAPVCGPPDARSPSPPDAGPAHLFYIPALQGIRVSRYLWPPRCLRTVSFGLMTGAKASHRSTALAKPAAAFRLPPQAFVLALCAVLPFHAVPCSEVTVYSSSIQTWLLSARRLQPFG